MIQAWEILFELEDLSKAEHYLELVFMILGVRFGGDGGNKAWKEEESKSSRKGEVRKEKKQAVWSSPVLFTAIKPGDGCFCSESLYLPSV